MIRSIIGNMLMAFMVLSLTSCKKEPVYPMLGGESYKNIYIHVGGALTEAHGSVFECPAKENTVTFQIVSYMGLDSIEVTEGEDFASVQEKPSFPPTVDGEDVYEDNGSIDSNKYIQTVSVDFKANVFVSNKSRKAVLRVQSPFGNGCIAEITILQKGK